MTLQNAQGLEQMAKARAKEMEFLDVVSDVTAEIELGALLQRVMIEATRMLNADRATLFLNDPRTGELFSRVAMGDGIGEIRLPNNAGIAGTVFQSKKPLIFLTHMLICALTLHLISKLAISCLLYTSPSPRDIS